MIRESEDELEQYNTDHEGRLVPQQSPCPNYELMVDLEVL
jgi:hypothetical protein